MKLSIEQANKLLSQVSAGVIVVADDTLADKEADLNLVLADITEAAAKETQPLLEAELKDKYEASFVGRYLGALRSAAQRVFNIPRKDMDEMNLEQVLAKCKSVVDSRYTQSDTERQTIWERTVQDYEDQIEEMKTNYEQQLNEERAKYTERDIAARCISIVEKMPRKGGDLQEQADLLRYKMQKVYEVRYNEDTKQLEFYKDGQQAVNEKDEPVNDEDFARSWAERTGILVKDTRHISPADVLAGQEQANTVPLPNPNAENGMNAIEAWTDS